MSEVPNTKDAAEAAQDKAPMQAYTAFLRSVENPPALDKTQYGWSTNLAHLTEYLRERLAGYGLAFMHGRKDTMHNGEVEREVSCVIVYEDGTVVGRSTCLLFPYGIASKADREAGRKPAITNDSIEAAETRAKRRLLAMLCGVVPDESDPNQVDPYDRHAANEAVMRSQKEMLAAIQSAEELASFAADVKGSRALTAAQKSTVLEWVQARAAERGWSSKAGKALREEAAK